MKRKNNDNNLFKNLPRLSNERTYVFRKYCTVETRYKRTNRTTEVVPTTACSLLLSYINDSMQKTFKKSLLKGLPGKYKLTTIKVQYKIIQL